MTGAHQDLRPIIPSLRIIYIGKLSLTSHGYIIGLVSKYNCQRKHEWELIIDNSAVFTYVENCTSGYHNVHVIIALY